MIDNVGIQAKTVFLARCKIFYCEIRSYASGNFGKGGGFKINSDHISMSKQVSVMDVRSNFLSTISLTQ